VARRGEKKEMRSDIFPCGFSCQRFFADMKRPIGSNTFFLSLLVWIFLGFTGEAFSAAPTGESTPLTVVDSLGRSIDVKRPVERVIALGNYLLEALKVLNASEKVVGIDTNSRRDSAYYFPDLCGLPDVGTWQEPNHEAIVSLHPHLVITSANAGRVLALENKLQPFSIPVLGLDFFREDRVKEELEILGRIMGKENDARKYILWRQEYEKIIRDYYVGKLDHKNMPRVFMEWGPDEGRSWGRGSSGQAICTLAGGNNIAADAQESPLIAKEWIVEQRPEIILKCVNLKNGQWGWPDDREPAEIINKLKQRPGLNYTDAVKNNRIYVLCSEITWGLDSIVAAAYWAKWFHPELTIAPEKIYREYLEHFLHVTYTENLIFAYPEIRPASN
jgi:iron complex transport system substrate-binding protein